MTFIPDCRHNEDTIFNVETGDSALALIQRSGNMAPHCFQKRHRVRFLVLAFLMVFSSLCAYAAGNATVYCSFSSTSAPCSIGNPTVNSIHLDSSGVIGSALRLCTGISGCPGNSYLVFPGSVVPMQRGTIAFWLKLNSQTETGPDMMDTYLAPVVGPDFEIDLSTANHAVNLLYYSSPIFNPEDKYGIVTSGNATLNTGAWYYIVFSWIGPVWNTYVNGALVNTQTLDSPFPTSPDMTEFRLGPSLGGGTMDVSVDELQITNFPWTQTEVTAVYNAGTGQSTALAPISSHGVTASAVWSPGYGQVAYFADSGNDDLASITSYTITAYQGSTPIGSVTDNHVVNGTAEGVIQFSTVPMTTGTYKVTAVSNSGIATASSSAYSYTQPTWLGNSFGLDNSVPSPWTNVTSTGTGGLQLGVYGRNYDVSSGFGLPNQIMSQGTDLLASPVSLSLVQAGSPLMMSVTSNTITSAAGNVVTWQGVGQTMNGAGGAQVKVTVTGSIEYDGYAPITVRLEPLNGNVTLDSIKLMVNVPAAIAKYTYYRTDSGNNQNAETTPTTVGQYATNLTAAQTGNQFTRQWLDVDLGNDTVGLHIGHFDQAGWNVNESNYWQDLVVESDGSVSYEALIANQSTTISAPMTFKFYLMAWPLKPLVSRGRLATAGAYGGSRAPASQLETWWDFTFANTWSDFWLGPTNLAMYKNNTTMPVRAGNTTYGKLVTPFTNAHVEIDLPGVFTGMTSPSVCDAEDANPEGGVYWSTPSRCTSDFWAANMNRLLNDPATPNVVDGYYIDESYSFFSGANLVQGGYVKPTGNHGYGMRYWEERNQMQRLYKLLQADGKAGDVYMHMSGWWSPIVASHALMALVNEGCCTSDSTTFAGTDHFTYLNANNGFLSPSAGGWGAGQWTLARYGRLGVETQSWRGINGDGPWFDLRQQQAECILQMEDITQQDQYLDWWQIKADWGIDNPATTLNLFNVQTGISSDNSNVKVTYYENGGSILAYAANFAATSQTANITLNALPLGWSSITSATQDILDTTCQSSGCSSGQISGCNFGSPTGCDATYHTSPLALGGTDHFSLVIPSHQCAVFTATGSTAAASIGIAAFSVTPSAIASGQSGTGTITLTAPAGTGGSVISLSNSSAQSLSMPTTVTVPQGSASMTFSVTAGTVTAGTSVTLTASYSSVSETFDLMIEPPAAALSALSVNPSTISSGQSATGTVSLTSAAGSGGAVISLANSNAAAASVPATVTIPQGSTSAMFSVTPAKVSAATTITLTASYAGVSKPFGVTVDPPAAALSSISVSPATVVSGQSGTGTVTLTAPAGNGGAVISLSSTNATAAGIPTTVTIPAGSASATFVLTAGTVSAATPVTLTATYSGVSETFAVAVNPPAVVLSQLSVSPATIISGQSGTGTVTLVAPAVVGGVVISLSSSNAGAVSAPTTVMVPQGSSSATFAVTASGVSAPTQVMLTASYAGASATFGVTINPAPAALSSLLIAPATLVSGQSATGTVTLTAPAGTGGVVVSLACSSPTSVTVPNTVTVPQGWTAVTFPATTEIVSAATPVTLSASYGQVRETFSLTINPPPAVLSEISVTPRTVISGRSATGTVKLTTAAPAGGASISLSSSNVSSVSVPAAVMIPEGLLSVNFPVGASAVTTPTSAILTAKYAGASTTFNLTIDPRRPEPKRVLSLDEGTIERRSLEQTDDAY